MAQIKPKKPKMTVRISRQSSCDAVDVSQLTRLVRFVCRRFDVNHAFIQISLVDDAAIKLLHKRFFNTSKTTDVISFDLSDPQAGQRVFDIIINTDQAFRQASKRRHSVAAETALYLVHGLLHQLGFDDLTIAKAKKMHLEEDLILQEAGYGAVYQTPMKGKRI